MSTYIDVRSHVLRFLAVFVAVFLTVGFAGAGAANADQDDKVGPGQEKKATETPSGTSGDSNAWITFCHKGKNITTNDDGLLNGHLERHIEDHLGACVGTDGTPDTIPTQPADDVSSVDEFQATCEAGYETRVKTTTISHSFDEDEWQWAETAAVVTYGPWTFRRDLNLEENNALHCAGPRPNSHETRTTVDQQIDCAAGLVLLLEDVTTTTYELNADASDWDSRVSGPQRVETSQSATTAELEAAGCPSNGGGTVPNVNNGGTNNGGTNNGNGTDAGTDPGNTGGNEGGANQPPAPDNGGTKPGPIDEEPKTGTTPNKPGTNNGSHAGKPGKDGAGNGAGGHEGEQGGNKPGPNTPDSDKGGDSDGRPHGTPVIKGIESVKPGAGLLPAEGVQGRVNRPGALVLPATGVEDNLAWMALGGLVVILIGGATMAIDRRFARWASLRDVLGDQTR